MATTMFVDKYFDELIARVGEDYANLGSPHQPYSLYRCG